MPPLLVRLGLARRRRRLPPDTHARFQERIAAVTAERRRRRHRRLASLALLLALVGGVAGLARSPLLAVDEVRVVGADGALHGEVAAAAGVREGANLLDLDLAAIERRVGALREVAAVAARRRPPSTVEVRVAVRRPVAVVETAGLRWAVAADGVVLGPAGNDDLVAVRPGPTFVPTGTVPVVDEAVQAALDLHRGLPAGVRDWVVAYEAPSVRGLRALLRVPTDTGPLEVWARLGSGDAGRKGRVLAALLQRIAARGVTSEQIEAVDVRAPERPVVVPAAAEG